MSAKCQQRTSQRVLSRERHFPACVRGCYSEVVGVSVDGLAPCRGRATELDPLYIPARGDRSSNGGPL
jgi:hypothetical protein